MNIEKIICCPLCKGDLKIDKQKGRQRFPESAFDFYYCLNCSHKYPLVDTIVDFSPHMPKKKSFIQQVMESKSFVEQYEGQWWRESWLFTAYAGISLKNEMALIKEIVHLKKNDTILDLACGTGLYTRYLLEESRERKAIGIDISWPMLKYAVKKVNDEKIENVVFLHGDSHYLPLKNGCIDAAVCCGSLHLFSDVKQALKELSRVLKPKGRLAVAVFLARSNLIGRIQAFWREAIYGIHPFTEADLEALLNEANFKPTIFHAWGVWMIASAIKRPVA